MRTTAQLWYWESFKAQGREDEFTVTICVTTLYSYIDVWHIFKAD